jgi:hypothetical protein
VHGSPEPQWIQGQSPEPYMVQGAITNHEHACPPKLKCRQESRLHLHFWLIPDQDRKRTPAYVPLKLWPGNS